MSLYSEAVSVVRSTVEKRQFELDVAAAAAREKSIRVCRELAVEGITDDNPARAVCELVAQTLEIGRSDGYPSFSIPETTKNVVVAANKAGLLPNYNIGKLSFYKDFSGLFSIPDVISDDYDAWIAAKDYRLSQLLDNL